MILKELIVLTKESLSRSSARKLKFFLQYETKGIFKVKHWRFNDLKGNKIDFLTLLLKKWLGSFILVIFPLETWVFIWIESY